MEFFLDIMKNSLYGGVVFIKIKSFERDRRNRHVPQLNLGCVNVYGPDIGINSRISCANEHGRLSDIC